MADLLPPAMVWFTNATNKGGGGVTISGNTFALREFNPATAAITNSNAITATGTIYLTGTYRV